MTTALRVLLDDDRDDRFHDHCGVVGIYGVPEAANLAYLALYALQHRGQESAGIVAGDGEELRRRIGTGLVADVFDEASLAALPGSLAVGHVRYATAGDAASNLRDAQPLLVRCQAGPIAIAHNGNIVNADHLRAEHEEQGSIFQTSSDTEVICHLVATRKGTMLERLLAGLPKVRGAYSLALTGDGRVYGARDPSGVRPLILGKLRDGFVLASESCAFDLIGATYLRDVEPGEVVVLDERGVSSHTLENPDGLPVANCIFEHVYFARPDSRVFGAPVHAARKRMGRQLAKESGVPADVVIPVPDSGVHAAMGYAAESGVPFDMGLTRNHYVGRTFIEPEQRIRHFGVKLKLNPVREILEGKRVVVVDDSIVRGTTSKKIVQMIRAVGAAEVHLRISAPPTTAPCYYGIDTPTTEELIAANKTLEQIRDFVTADSLAYLSRDGLKEAVRGAGVAGRAGFCDACFSGEYPIAITRHRARTRAT
jgi:amidophosphoribosyltransferase